jgi:pimeloyl-ACP methyl ester carboxylesterase
MVTQSANWKMLANALGESFSDDEINEYRRAWSQPGANSATINWYRALFKQNAEDRPNALIDVPTLVVWGKQDPHIMWQSAEPSAAMTTSGQVAYIDDATHWVLRDAPEETGELIVHFFQ